MAVRGCLARPIVPEFGTFAARGGVAGEPCHKPNPISAVAAALRAPPTVTRSSDKSGIGTGIKKAAIRAASPSACAWPNGPICPVAVIPFPARTFRRTVVIQQPPAAAGADSQAEQRADGGLAAHCGPRSPLLSSRLADHRYEFLARRPRRAALPSTSRASSGTHPELDAR